ncbi:hypothetical protein D9757_008774 [Collybiopsis confluens]|uniref:Uncharacterized protein n=1 Tax=Collybiopsis confluens TaxID=2823264 RepID=A0A8H5M186_9AGAR|nr:hypothetical protein D9757_008774 [Collybiopsis confluens]
MSAALSAFSFTSRPTRSLTSTSGVSSNNSSIAGGEMMPRPVEEVGAIGETPTVIVDESCLWGAGPALNQSQLTQWCQFRPEYDPKRLEHLGPFDYAFLMLEDERLVNPKAPALYSCFSQNGEPEAVFILKAVFAPRTSSPPDLEPTPTIRKAAASWLQSKKLGQEIFPYRQFLWSDASALPVHLKIRQHDYIKKAHEMRENQVNGKSNAKLGG